jgi:hypothetical protein
MYSNQQLHMGREDYAHAGWGAAVGILDREEYEY